MLKTRMMTHDKHIIFIKCFPPQDSFKEAAPLIHLYISFYKKKKKKTSVQFMLDFSEGCDKPLSSFLLLVVCVFDDCSAYT